MEKLRAELQAAQEGGHAAGISGRALMENQVPWPPCHAMQSYFDQL